MNRQKELKSVMVWIHGGAFVSGYLSTPNSEPSTLVASSDVIVVTINYRLGALGFMHLADSKATGNAGFLDQKLAMEWVHANIKFFGGDNNKITLFGESAGAWSAGFHLFHEPSWPYFRNVIMQSGGPTGTSIFNIYLFYYRNGSGISTYKNINLTHKNENLNLTFFFIKNCKKLSDNLPHHQYLIVYHIHNL